MQILFISDEIQIINFLSGAKAEAIMPSTGIEVKGVSENATVVIICSGESVHYTGSIVSVDTSYSPASDEKWLALKFMVRRTGAGIPVVHSQDRRADA